MSLELSESIKNNKWVDINLTIRPESKRDYLQIKQINDLAFNQENEGIMIENLRSKPEFIPELSLIAKLENEIVGHILFLPLKIKNNNSEFTTLSLAPMAVKSEYQKMGIGGKLMKKGFEVSKELGFTSIIVLGYPEYYPKFGFKPAINWGIKPPIDVPSEVFMAIELEKDALKDVSGTVEFPLEYYDAL